MPAEELAKRILEEQALWAERARARGRERARNQRELRSDPIGFDPFQTTNLAVVAGGDAGYLAKKSMRAGTVGFWIRCQSCGKKFESKGMAHCEPCMVLTAEERRAMVPAGRPCEAPGCDNVIAGTARADARYCSMACRRRAQRTRQDLLNVHKNGVQVADTAPPENVTDSAEKTQQNQRAKSEVEKPDPLAAFERMRAGRVLSDWKPTGDGAGVEDIPDFLRRT